MVEVNKEELTKECLLTEDEKEKVNGKCGKRPWDSWLDPYLEEQLAKAIPIIADSIKRELEKNHPYGESIFVRTAGDTLELMRQHGLTDAEITGINGSACRDGYNAALYAIQHIIEDIGESGD